MTSESKPRRANSSADSRMRSMTSASSSVAGRTRTSGVRVEPVGDPAAVLDTMFRFASTSEVVVVFREAHEDRLLAQDLERDEELLGLLDRAAEIALRVEDEERRLHLGHVGQRRTLDQLLAPTPRRRIPHLVLPEVPADVARPERGDVVRDAALRGGSTEAVSVADDPVRHESAVAPAGQV